MSHLYNFELKDIDLNEVQLNRYKGKTLLIVNVASMCGFTPQYGQLQELYDQYKRKGFEILAFPCNQFGKQEPRTNNEIKGFCDLNYNISFKMFDKIDVNGINSAPLFAYLKEEAPGILGTRAIKWNFTKFLVSKHGRVVKRFSPTEGKTKIESELLNII